MCNESRLRYDEIWGEDGGPLTQSCGSCRREFDVTERRAADIPIYPTRARALSPEFPCIWEFTDVYEYAVNIEGPVVLCDSLLRAAAGALRARGVVQASTRPPTRARLLYGAVE